MNENKPLGIGLVGAGGFGAFCLDAFSAMPEAKIVAVADVARARADELAAKFGAAAYSDIESLLRDPAVNIVALNTPPFLHGSQGLAALEAGKHLFCEKPLAITAEDGRRMIDLAAKKNLALTVNYVMRQNPFWKAAAELRRSGVFGPLLHMDLMNHAAGLSLPADHWFWDESKSGGIWIEHGVHFFDAFAWVSDETARVMASQQFKRADGAVDRVEALLQYGSTAAHCYHGFDQSAGTEQTTVQLSFENAYLTLREWVPTSLEVLTPIAREKWGHLLPGRVEYTQRDEKRTFAVARSEGNKSAVYRKSVQDGMRNLIAAINSRDVASKLAVTGEAALASLQTAIDATRS